MNTLKVLAKMVSCELYLICSRSEFPQKNFQIIPMATTETLILLGLTQLLVMSFCVLASWAWPSSSISIAWAVCKLWMMGLFG